MKKLTFLFLIIFCSASIYGQTLIIDSLKKEALISSDTTLSIVYGELFWNFTLQSELDSALKYANLEKFTAEKSNWEKGIAQGHNDLGIIYYYLTKYDEALTHYNLSLESRRKTNDLYGVGALYNKIGLIQQERGEYSDFVYTQIEALKIFETLKDTLNYTKVLNNLGEVYFQLRDYDNAKETHREAIKLRKLINDKEGLAVSYLNLGNCYLNNEEALELLNKALDLLLELNLTLQAGIAHHNLAITHKQLGNYEKTLIHINEAIKIKEEHGGLATIADTYMAAGDIFRQNKEFKKAIYYLKQSEKISTENEINNNFEFLYHYLATYYSDIGKMDSAYYYEKKCVDIKNQLFQDKMYNHVAGMQIKYDTEKKEAENEQLKIENELKVNELATKQAEQKTLIISFIALLLFIVGFAVFVSYKRKIKSQKQLQAEEKLRFKAVIEAEEKERIRIAKELHDGLGQLLSTAKLNVASLEGNVDKEDEILVKNASDLIDNAVKEVRTISHNMMPVALTQLGLIPAIKELTTKMNDSGLLNVTLESNVQNRLNSSIEIAIYRVVQEILNNIIKHAQAKEITIQLTIEKQRLTLQISDDGVGFNTTEIDNSKGIGWKSVFSRIAMLNGNIDVNSSKEKGTNLLVSIPVNE